MFSIITTELIQKAIDNKIITSSVIHNASQMIKIGSKVWFYADPGESLVEAVDDYVSELFEDPDYHEVYKHIKSILEGFMLVTAA